MPEVTDIPTATAPTMPLPDEVYGLEPAQPAVEVKTPLVFEKDVSPEVRARDAGVITDVTLSYRATEIRAKKRAGEEPISAQEDIILQFTNLRDLSEMSDDVDYSSNQALDGGYNLRQLNMQVTFENGSYIPTKDGLQATKLTGKKMSPDGVMMFSCDLADGTQVEIDTDTFLASIKISQKDALLSAFPEGTASREVASFYLDSVGEANDRTPPSDETILEALADTPLVSTDDLAHVLSLAEGLDEEAKSLLLKTLSKDNIATPRQIAQVMMFTDSTPGVIHEKKEAKKAIEDEMKKTENLIAELNKMPGQESAIANLQASLAEQKMNLQEISADLDALAQAPKNPGEYVKLIESMYDGHLSPEHAMLLKNAISTGELSESFKDMFKEDPEDTPEMSRMKKLARAAMKGGKIAVIGAAIVGALLILQGSASGK